MRATIDLNCDLGESYGAWRMGEDAAVLPLISSANVACGFHAGDPAVMRPLDALLTAFVSQRRMKLPGSEYHPCYRLVA